MTGPVRKSLPALLLLVTLLPVFSGPADVAVAAPNPAECMTADADGAYTVPFDWALKPSDMARGEQFRLLFITSRQRDADDPTLSTYDTFVQNAAKVGHPAISDSCATTFKVVGSNSGTDARVHTSTTGVGVPIYWLNGARLADDYADFYDGAWGNYGMTEENGRRVSYTEVFTGSEDDGTKAGATGDPDRYVLGATYKVANNIDEQVATGDPSGVGNPLSGGLAFHDHRSHFYALSPVFIVEKPTIGFSETAVTVNEGATTLNLRVALSHPRREATSFSVVTTDNGATANADYTPGPNTGSIPAGRTETTVSIGIVNDTTAESRERFIATITGPSDGVALADETKTIDITIVDDDGTGRLVITPSSPLALTEGGSGTYMVELASAPTHDVTVEIASDDPDVTTSPGTLTFMPGNWNTAQTVTVNSRADYDIWDDTATLTHTTASTDPNYDGSASFAAKKVEVPDSIIAFHPPTVSFKDANLVVVEDTGARGDDRFRGEVGINLVLSRYIVGPGFVTITATSGTATAGEDFRSVTHRAHIRADVGETTVYFNLILDDNKLEDDETFTLTLSDPSRVTLGERSTMNVTIEDNEYKISVASGQPRTTVSEGDGYGEVRFKLSRALRRTINVDFRYQGVFTAEAGRDFLPKPTRMKVPAGQTEFTLRVPIIDDNIPEQTGFSADFFQVTVFPDSVPQDGGYGSFGGDGTATNFKHWVYIDDNDGTAGIEVSPSTTLFEGQTRTITIENVPRSFGSIWTSQPERNFYFITDNATYPFTTTTNRNPDQKCAVWKDYNSDGVDICIKGFHWNPAERTASIQLTALRDREVEGDEYVYMRFGKWLDLGANSHVFKITVTDQPTEYQEITPNPGFTFWCRVPFPTVTDLFPGKKYQDLTDAEKNEFIHAKTPQVFPAPPVLVAEWDKPSYEVGDTATIKFSAQDEEGNPKRVCSSVAVRYQINPHPAYNGGQQGPIYQDPTIVWPRYATIRPGDTEVEVSFDVQREGTMSFQVTGAGTNDITARPSHVPVRKLKDGDGNDLPTEGLTVTVVQNAPPPPPEVRVVGSFSGDESNQVGFTLQADPAPAVGDTLDVSVTITAEGDFGVQTGTRTVTIGSSGYGELVLDPDDDQTAEPDGSVTLTINPGDDYTLGLFSTQTTPIEDNDGPDDGLNDGTTVPETNDEEETPSQPPLEKHATLIARIQTDMQNPNYGGEAHDLKRVLKTLGVPEYADYNGNPVGVQEATNRRTMPRDNPHWEGIAHAIEYTTSYVPPPPPVTPEITINADATGITEGGTATFTITADPAPAGPITVNIGLTETGDFGATGAATVTVSGATTTYTVTTGNDNTDETDGSVTATVQAGTGYTIGAASSATVNIADNDDPPDDPPVTDNNQQTTEEVVTPPEPPLVKYAQLIARIKADMRNPNYQGEKHDLKRVLKTLGVAEYADYNGNPVGVKEATNRRTMPRDNPHWEGIADAIRYATTYTPP